MSDYGLIGSLYHRANSGDLFIRKEWYNANVALALTARSPDYSIVENSLVVWFNGKVTIERSWAYASVHWTRYE